MLALAAAGAGPSASPPDSEADFDTASGDSASPDTAEDCDTGDWPGDGTELGALLPLWGGR